jgi:GST-like protein
MTDDTRYTPPKVWTWDKENGGANGPASTVPSPARPMRRSCRSANIPSSFTAMGTPNGVKVTVMFEELLAAGHDAEYDAWLIKIGDGDQFGSGFVEMNPNSKIPALDGLFRRDARTRVRKRRDPDVPCGEVRRVSGQVQRIGPSCCRG